MKKVLWNSDILYFIKKESLLYRDLERKAPSKENIGTSKSILTRL